jgi:hypothetical protein
VLGVRGHGNPLFYSVLAPLGAAALAYGVPRLRGILSGFSLGVGTHLIVASFAGLVAVQYIPHLLYLHQLWMPVNAVACCALAYIIAKR